MKRRHPRVRGNPRLAPNKKNRSGPRFQRPARGDSSPQTHAGDGGFPTGRLVVGIHAVRELIKVRPEATTQLWLRDGFRAHPDLLALNEKAEKVGIRTTVKGTGILDRISSSNQGVVAFASESPALDLESLKTRSSATLVVLDGVEDPHNLGAVLRTAWLLGAQGVLLPKTRAASLSAAVSKVAQGAVEHVPVAQDSGLLETLKDLKAHGFWLLGLSHKGHDSVFKSTIPEKVIWVLGSEAAGIRKPIERECDHLLTIPQVDADASYNVSVAAAIALAETYRQRPTSP